MPVTINGTTGLSGVDGSAATPPITGADTDSGIFFPAANTVAVTTGGSERMRIDSSGNVGIGTTLPVSELEVSGAGDIITASSVTTAGLVATTTTANIAYCALINSARSWNIRNDNSGNFVIRDQTATTNRISINTSGNVGIGGSIPASNPKLSMYGGIRFLANETAAATYTGIGSIASDTVSISTSGTERLNIGTGGLITQTNATSGAGAIVGEQTFQLAANGPATTQNVFADFFGTTSSISLEASSTYEIVAYAAFLKTTAGTAIWQMLASSAPTRMQGWFIGSPLTGIGQATIASGTSGVAGSQASTTATFAATGSLSTGVNHNVQMTMLVQTNLATNFRLQLATVTGTGTPLAGSYYTVKKISATTGTFV